MLFLLFVFSCVKSISFKSKVFPLEVLENFEENENYNYLKELGLLDTLKSMSEILLSEPLTFNKYEKDLIQSILNKDLNSSKEIYDGKEFSNKEGLTLLNYTALIGAEDIFEYLVKEKRESIKERDEYGRTFLHFAFISRNFNLCIKVFNFLEDKEKEALLKEKDKNGASCFHYLAFSNLFKRYKEEKEVEKNALINFLKFSDKETFKISIGSNCKDNKGLLPLHYAAYFGDLELCKEFLEGLDEEDIKSEEIEGLGRITPLSMAYLLGESEVVKYFEKGNLKIWEEDLKLKEFLELSPANRRSSLPFRTIRGSEKAINDELAKEHKEYGKPVKGNNLEVSSEYLLKNEYDFKQKLEKGKGSILHELIKNNKEKETFFLLNKLKELTEKERDEFLKHKDEKGDEALYLAIDKENVEVVEKILEIYSEKARNERLCFEYKKLYFGFKEYHDKTLLDRAIKNRSVKMMMSLVELKKKYRPEDVENSKSSQVQTELVITSILEGIKRIVEERKQEELFENEEILLNEEEQKESIILKLIEENIKKKKDKEEVVKKDNKFRRLKKFKRLMKENKKEILILASYVGDKGVIGRYYTEEKEVNTEYLKDLRTILTMLPLAIMQGHEEIVKILLTKEVGLDLRNKRNVPTPLYIASEFGQKKLVELLIEKGAAIDLAEKEYGLTPLIAASQQGYKEVVELLLTKGAEVDLASDNGWTPLSMASANGRKEVVELLLSKGAAIDLADKNGWTPLYIASGFGHKEVVELLLTNEANIDLANNYGCTPLFVASHNGRKEVVELLLSKGASIDLANKDGETPLYITSKAGKKEVIELLLSKGAAIDLASDDGSTPLYIASAWGHKEVVELLLTNKANIDLAMNDGFTALYIASANGRKKVVELLLNKGATIDLAEKEYGLTPLYIASLQGHKRVVELLLSKGAAIDLAEKEYGLTPLYIASFNGKKGVVEVLINKGASIDLADKDGETPLFVASFNGKKEIVELLLSNGALIDLARRDGSTPLYAASVKGHKEVVELLLIKGASIDLAQRDGSTPLHISSQKGHKEVVELLLTKGANPNTIVDKDSNETILMWAIKNKYKEILRLLIEKGAEIPKSKGDFKRVEFINEMIDYAIEIKDSTFLFTAGILNDQKEIGIYSTLANCLPLSYMKENFFHIPSLNYYRYNSLHLCILQESTNSLQELLIDTNIREFVNSYDNREKQTCLSLAIKLNKVEHIKVLLSFLASPIYLKYSLINTKQVNALDIWEIKEYVANEMLFEVLRKGRSEDAAKLLFGHIKAGSQLELQINNFSYRDSLNLKATDERKKNVFHYLAKHAFDESDLDHFFSRSVELPSFSMELMFAYDKFGMTPFHYALLDSNEYFVQHFLTNPNMKRKDVMKDTKNGESVSSLIKRSSLSKGLINLFVEHVWSIKEKSVDKNVYSFLANKQEKSDDKVSLLKGKIKELNVFDKTDKNIVYSILKSDDTEAVVFVLDNSNLKESLMQIADIAVSLNAYECLKVILSKLPEEKAKEFVSLEILFKTCEENKVEVLEVLAKVNEEKLVERDKEGNTVLHRAALMKKEEIVRKLLKYEIVIKNINVQNEMGNTAMHNAHVALSPNLIDTLKEAGADVSIKNSDEKRAIDLLKVGTRIPQEESIRMGTMYASLCALLNKEYDTDSEKVLHLAVLSQEDWVIKETCTNGLINSMDDEGNTALHLAVKDDLKEEVKLLLQKGANFSIKNNDGETSVDKIQSEGVLIQILLNAIGKGITSNYLLNLQNKDGNTLLHLVAERVKIKKLEQEVETKSGEMISEEMERKDQEFIKTLLDNSASIEKVNKEGKTALHIAKGRSMLLHSLMSNHKASFISMQFREERHWKQKAEEDERRGRDRQEQIELSEVMNNKRRHDEDLCTKRRAIHVVVEMDDEYSLLALLEMGSNPEWQDIDGKNCYEIAVNKGNVSVFKILVNKMDLFNDSNCVSPIYLVVEKGMQFLGGKLFEVVFERMKEERMKGGMNFKRLREMKQDPIKRILEKDDKPILEKMMEVGLRIVDEDNNNLIQEAIFRESKKVFKYLVSKIENKETVLGKNRKERTAMEEAQQKISFHKDDFYVKVIQEKLEEMKK